MGLDDKKETSNKLREVTQKVTEVVADVSEKVTVTTVCAVVGVVVIDAMGVGLIGGLILMALGTLGFKYVSDSLKTGTWNIRQHVSFLKSEQKLAA